MKTLIVIGLVLLLFQIGCFAAGEDARARAGSGSSVEGGVSLGGTGINAGAMSPLGRGIDINRAPPGSIRLPANRRDREDHASAGSSRDAQPAAFPATDLGGEAEREEDAIAHKMRER